MCVYPCISGVYPSPLQSDIAGDIFMCRGREWNLAVLQHAPRARRVVEKNISLLDCAGGRKWRPQGKGEKDCCKIVHFLRRAAACKINHGSFSKCKKIRAFGYFTSYPGRGAGGVARWGG